MTRKEAIEFYLSKAQRARCAESRLAYDNILVKLSLADNHKDARELITGLATNKRNSPTRRAIYRKALRELEV